MITELQKLLFSCREEEYAQFQAKLAPTIDAKTCIGVRLPKLREIAKEFTKSDEYDTFMNTLPHSYYDENILHSILICKIKNYDQCIEELVKFLPYIDNWAVCDTIRPNCLKKNKEALLSLIKKWVLSSHTYTCRLGVDFLMTFFLDDDFKPEYHDIPAKIISNEYYVNMMIAWYFATALAKQWEHTIPYLEKRLLPKWVHNKTIQKAKESFRISDEEKAYLNTLKME